MNFYLIPILSGHHRQTWNKENSQPIKQTYICIFSIKIRFSSFCYFLYPMSTPLKEAHEEYKKYECS